MALADLTAPRVQRGPRCGLSRIIERLEPSERAALIAMLGDPDWSATGISEALESEGYGTLTHSQVATCRLGRCQSCPSDEWCGA